VAQREQGSHEIFYSQGKIFQMTLPWVASGKFVRCSEGNFPFILIKCAWLLFNGTKSLQKTFLSLPHFTLASLNRPQFFQVFLLFFAPNSHSKSGLKQSAITMPQPKCLTAQKYLLPDY
jgi:hypothetical protein